ncbi:MAG: lysophospholipid acyltransferase family protein [Betaproteobacteria bacterium]|jgi:KDO2-lipid IV(A) lauroyltransferase|nr:lysophospholipid acyltransferase family protein [Betaproteobacteria bacterium]NBX90911.1 lysophospholipid acyltransferase family protein [Betaproteobacteria bacterium]
MIFWFRFFSHWPLWALHALGHVVGWLAWGLSATYRRRFLANVAAAGLPFGQVWQAVGQAGCLSLELPRLWMGHKPPVVWGPQSAAVIEAAFQAGDGVLMLTPHLGCFEVAAQVIAERFSVQYGPFTVLFRPSRKPSLAKIMAQSRTRPGLQAVPTTLSGVRQMIKALRAGQAVGLLPDQVPPDGMGLWTPFFGQPAYTMSLAARLAQQTGARVVLVWGERLPWGQGYVLHAQDMAQALSQDIAQALLQINQAMEALILTRPQQYLWGYERYKQPRQEVALPPESATQKDFR